MADHAGDQLAVHAARRARGAERSFRVLHLISSAAYSLSHGLNDAQKTMGIITVLLYSTGYLHGEFEVPHWVAISCYIAIALGTLSGGWKIIETMGIAHHQAVAAPGLQRLGRRIDHGVRRHRCSAFRCRPRTPSPAASSARASRGAPRAVRWGVARNVVIAWVITIPASAAVGALFYLLTRLF